VPHVAVKRLKHDVRVQCDFILKSLDVAMMLAADDPQLSIIMTEIVESFNQISIIYNILYHVIKRNNPFHI
jgi:hypothetical protein